MRAFYQDLLLWGDTKTPTLQAMRARSKGDRNVDAMVNGCTAESGEALEEAS